MELSTNDKIALATLILSIPSIIATVLGVIISYRSLKQFQVVRQKSDVLPIYRLPIRYITPHTTGSDIHIMRFDTIGSVGKVAYPVPRISRRKR
ncbi:hypothetical protein B0J14DRAFT_649577 [Halenospora varia]|nr:hypothetical protein B0J14DRAFT_649577 [Halenospora varia]